MKIGLHQKDYAITKFTENQAGWYGFLYDANGVISQFTLRGCIHDDLCINVQYAAGYNWGVN